MPRNKSGSNANISRSCVVSIIQVANIYLWSLNFSKIIRMKEYRLQRIEIEEIARDREILALVLLGLLYSDYFTPITISWSTQRIVCIIAERLLYWWYSERSRVKCPGDVFTTRSARSETRSDRDEKIGQAGITRGVPWGSPRQANPTNSHRRARSRPVDSAHSRWESVDRSVVPRC